MKLHSRLLGWGATAVVTAVILSACGGSGGGSTPERPTSVPADAPFIDQYGLKFSPNSLSVKSGAVVYFANSETAIHTVTVNGKNESGTMNKNDVFQWTAKDPGSYKITCDYHPQMKATITVQ